jgi:hypothetical protein
VERRERLGGGSPLHRVPQRKFGAQKERALVSRRVRGNLGEGLQMWDAIWLAGGAVFVALFIAFAWVTK